MKRSIWHPDYLALRQALKELRQECGLTQVQLAEKLNKPQSFVAKFENGDRNLDFLEVIAVCTACQINLSDFEERLKKLTKTNTTNN